jgi:hypothetical protein
MGWVFLGGANVFWQILGDYIPDECVVLIADVGLAEMETFEVRFRGMMCCIKTGLVTDSTNGIICLSLGFLKIQTDTFSESGHGLFPRHCDHVLVLSPTTGSHYSRPPVLLA